MFSRYSLLSRVNEMRVWQTHHFQGFAFLLATVTKTKNLVPGSCKISVLPLARNRRYGTIFPAALKAVMHGGKLLWRRLPCGMYFLWCFLALRWHHLGLMM